ncbi:hypothetical protein NIE79_004720 [Micromonospora sp. NIE79]|uniref:Uncharacterized protein n=1 Tax=Micromonospora trifolii TaxID=2911208 RepID=A0ABS9N8J1_9ACTN|nr:MULTISPECIES: hypothetical protein [Micromonospora]MCG5446153.1 hypothetical protein [Micromonospora trifolii]
MSNRSSRVRRHVCRCTPKSRRFTYRWQWQKITNAVVLLMEVTAKAVIIYRAWKGM